MLLNYYGTFKCSKSMKFDISIDIYLRFLIVSVEIEILKKWSKKCLI